MTGKNKNTLSKRKCTYVKNSYLDLYQQLFTQQLECTPKLWYKPNGNEHSRSTPILYAKNLTRMASG